MKNFLRNSRPLPYKTLATGILFNGVVEFTADDFDENNDIVVDNLKDGITILYFDKTITSANNGGDAQIILQNYERTILGPAYMQNYQDNFGNLFDGISYNDDGNNYVLIKILKNKTFVQPWDITVDGKEYKDGMPLLVNKIGGLIFVEFYTEI